MTPCAVTSRSSLSVGCFARALGVCTRCYGASANVNIVFQTPGNAPGTWGTFGASRGASQTVAEAMSRETARRYFLRYPPFIMSPANT